MGNLVERLRAIFQRFLEWWNRFTTRQKTLIVSLCAGVIVVIAVVVAFITQPKYQTLVINSTTKETSEVQALLDSIRTGGAVYQRRGAPGSK